MRRIYGPAEPIRREMELSLCQDAFGRGIGYDVLRGTDGSLSEVDFMRQDERGGETIQDLITRRVGK